MTTRLVMPVDSSVDLRHRQAVDEVLEADDAVDFGEDRPGVGIPLGQALAALDLVAVVDEQARAEGDAVGRALGAVAVDDDDLHVAAHGDQRGLPSP